MKLAETFGYRLKCRSSLGTYRRAISSIFDIASPDNPSLARRIPRENCRANIEMRVWRIREFASRPSAVNELNNNHGLEQDAVDGKGHVFSPAQPRERSFHSLPSKQNELKGGLRRRKVGNDIRRIFFMIRCVIHCYFSRMFN